MTTIGLYTATENELGAVQAAAERLDDIDLVVRSKRDFEDRSDVAAFTDALHEATAVICWLHGGEESMPGYSYAVSQFRDAGVPLVIKATGDAFAREDTTVTDTDRAQLCAYLDRGGTVNIANAVRFLAQTYDDAFDADVADPVDLPTEGVYHPDYPSADDETLLATFDPDAPTVGVWFYESHWTHENTRYVDAQVRALESLGANVLPVLCNPVTDADGQADAQWTATEYFSDDAGEPLVDAVLSSFMFSLSMSERGRDAADGGWDGGGDGDSDGDSDKTTPEDAFLETLGVPVIQTVTTMRSRARYAASDTGVMGFELALSVALPEFDGTVITHPISGKERLDDEADIGASPTAHMPIRDRVDHAARLAVNWATLKHTPNEETRVAVVLHNYPPSDDGIGTAFGLDSPASTVSLLDTLAARGYDLGTEAPTDPPRAPVTDGAALIDTLTAQLTLDDRWVAPADVRERSVDTVSPATYADWFADTAPGFRERVLEAWGTPPDRPFAIPGVEFGNVLVTVQPPRGFGMDPEKVYHDSDLQPPHDYVAFYAWLRNRFEADAVVHLGTHGSLEWLPGKTVGLDAESAPDGLIDDIPNVYPYIINNPGEGTQATRRSYASLVDYLTPVMRRAGSYDGLAELEDLARRYREAGGTEARADDGARLETLIRERAAELDLAVELGIEGHIDERVAVRGPEEAGTTLSSGDVDGDVINADELVERIHAYLTDVKNTQIRLGLHTLGEPPVDDRLTAYLIALTRLANPGGPSLRESVAGVLGVDTDRMLDAPGEYDDTLGMTYSEAADAVYETSEALVRTLEAHDFDIPPAEPAAGPDDETTMNLLVVDIDPLGDARVSGGAHDDLREALAYICDDVVPRVRGATDEIPRLADALEGEYVPPGGSGAPTRGGVDLLPTGRNFYTIDPRKVPAKAAWEVGREIAADTLACHHDEHGAYPEEIGVVAWGTPTVRTRGETIAQVLALMGVEPVWTDAGRVESVEPIPLETLDRPRIDVTTRVSGLFRDAFPQAASVIHDAVEAVVALDEPHERNYVKKHVETERDALEAAGHDDPEAAATHRVFTTRPGGYGAGTNKAVDEGVWEDRSDLADVYVQWGGYALGSRGTTTEAHDAFERRLSTVEATVKIEDTMEQDEFDSSDWYAFHGGFITAVTEVSGTEPASYVGDSSDPDRVSVYTNETKVRKAMRARVLNPDWLDSMEEHGYKGAGDLSKTVDVTLGWDATTGVISDRLWEEVATRYALDAERADWMRSVNPWALESITDTLLEAVDRGLWDADAEMVDALRDRNLEADGDVEAHAARDPTEVAGDDD